MLKPYNNWGWNQFQYGLFFCSLSCGHAICILFPVSPRRVPCVLCSAYAMRFIRDEPIVGRECAIADVEDLTQYHNATPANPNMTDYEFDEVYHQDPVTGCGQYMLNRNDKYLDKKFGLGLLVCVAPLSATLLALGCQQRNS